MSIQDPISNMFSSIMNAQAVAKQEITIPVSKLKLAIAKLLKDEGYISDYCSISLLDKNILKIKLKYNQSKPVISMLKRVSRPGLKAHPNARLVTLYRGVNRLADHDVLEKLDNGRYVILLNNLSSFTCSRERACELGDYILEVTVPLTKIFFYCGLLPGVLQGENEFLVTGGVVAAALSTI